jgi:uncharacterized protein
MRVWIDLSNSPHPPLFAPIVRALESLDHEALLTARDHAQTLPLSRKLLRDVEEIGGPAPASRVGKGAAVAARATALRSWAQARRPEVALSHNSYAQVLAGRSLGLPVVTAMDYEHQPANHLAFRLASSVLVPEVFPADALRRCGAGPQKVRRYPGLKELLYMGDFEPDAGALSELGLARNGSETIVVARTPPTGALYHRHGNSLFMEAIRTVSAQSHVRCVVLARRADQRAVLEREAPACIVPAAPVDARSLMHAADLVIGAGGTMTREAALLGVPTLTVFAGRDAAVDAWLERQGRLRRLRVAEQVGCVRRREHDPRPLAELRSQGGELVDRFVSAVLEVAGSSRRGRRRGR